MSDTKKKIGALWTKELRDGKKILTGSVELNGEKVKVAVFRNSYKTEPKQPDYIVYLDDYKPKDKPAAEGDDGPADDFPF